MVAILQGEIFAGRPSNTSIGCGSFMHEIGNMLIILLKKR